MKRVALAFLVAPLPAAVTQAVFVAMWPKPGMGVFEHPQSMFVVICILFYAIELVLALPLYLAMRRRLPRRMLPYGAAGALIVLLPIVIGLSLAKANGNVSTYVLLYNFAFFAIGGFLAGLIFWSFLRAGAANADLRDTFA